MVQFNPKTFKPFDGQKNMCVKFHLKNEIPNDVFKNMINEEKID